MDPLTLFALANGAVAAVKKGCALYKEIQSAAGDVKEVLQDLEQQFNSRHKNKPPSVAEKNQYITEKNRVIELHKKGGETTSVYTEIGQHLGTYFDNYYKCLAVLEEEERRSRNEVYIGDDSLGKRALQRVLLKKQLEQMSKDLRELMVYHCPPELGALWTEVEAMMKVLGKEQAGAVAIQMRKDELVRKKIARQKKKMKYRLFCWGMSTFVVIYFIWLVWAVVQVRIERYPELGRCLLPKGTWLYKHYNNLKWVECEIKSKD